MKPQAGTHWNRAAAALALPIWVYDADNRLIDSNEAAVAGQMPRADMVPPGTPLAEVLRALAFRGILGAGDPAGLVERHLAVDRTQPWRQLVRDRDGKCREILGTPLAEGGFVVTALDVTAPHAVAEEAQARAHDLDRVLAQLQRGVAVFDADSRLVLHNAAYEALLLLPRGYLRPGTTRGEILRKLVSRGSFLIHERPGLLAPRIARPRQPPEAFERERADGRVIAFATQPMPGGGSLIEVGDITPMRRAEQQAAERAALLDGVLEALPHGVVVTGSDGRVTTVNAAHRQIMGDVAARLGETRESLGRRRAEAGEYGPGDPAVLAAERLRGPQGHSIARRIRPDGRVVDIRYAPLVDGGHVQVVTDITALDRAQREAQDRSALLRLMLDNMRHGIALFGPDRRLVAANPLAERLMGLPAGGLVLGRAFDDLIDEQAARGEFCGLPPDTYYIADRSRPLSYSRTRPNGAVLEVISDPTPGGGFVVTYSDITARRAAEHAATERAKTLQAMLDYSRHGIAMFDAGGHLVAANALFGRATSIPAEQLVAGTPLAELLSLRAANGGFGDDPEIATHEMARLLAFDRRQQIRGQRTLADGRIIDICSDPIPDGGWVVTYSDVTPLARAEAEARARAALLQTTLDHMNHSIVLYGPDRRVLLANRLSGPAHGIAGIETRQGTSLETLVGEQLAAGFFGTGEAAERSAAAVLALDRTQPLRYQRALPDGRIVAIASDPTPEGGFVVTNTDITALRRAEAEAETRAEILSVMLDNMRHGICLFDRDGRVVAANAMTLEMTGLAAEDLTAGASIADLRQAQRRRGEFDAVGDWQPSTDGGPDALRMDSYRRKRPDGAVIEVVTARTPEGGFVRSFTDVTPLAAAEAEARRRGDVQQAMLEHIRHGILLVDARRRIVAANPVLRKMLALDEAVVAPGRTYDQMLETLRARGEFGSEPGASAVVADLAAFDRRRSRRIERTRPDGATLDVISDPTPDGGFVLSFSDTTEQRRARAELERARDAAEAADRAKSRFLATMSHELRTPLNAVIGFSEAIRADPDAPRNAEYLDAIGEAGRHLLGLIDDILDVARSETSGVQLQEAPVELGAVAAAAVRVMAAAAETAGVTLELDWPEGLPRVRADALRVRQVLLNLLSNAVKFTPRGGRVRVSAALDAAYGLELTVTDTGIGIAAADIPRAFEPFVQIDNALSRQFPGSGLGLYLSRALAAAHGAELTLDSRPGRGTTARLRFPRERLIAPLAA